MPTPSVSVLMPVYNAAQTLDETLASLQAQTLDDFEIVAVDDGSQDDSLDLLRAWARRDHRLQAIDGGRKGLIGALNYGLKNCRAPLVARMDADDRVHPQRLAQQRALLDGDASLSVVGSLVELFPRDSLSPGMAQYENWLNGLVDHPSISREIFIESPIVHPSAMVRRRELLELGAYQDRGWPEDYDLWLRYFTAGRRFAKVPQTLVYWREHPNRLTRTDRRYSVENFLRAKAHYLLKGPLQNCDGLVVWGAGKTGRRLSKHLIRGGCPPAVFIDIVAAKIGTTLRQIPIVSTDDLPAWWNRFRRPFLLAAVASHQARGLIRAHLRQMELSEGTHFLCVA
ncbi:MAG: glycosyltransferase [Candidatus Latescibacteria bacterium]|nr:glycosyltransferase [Candidatus Latescibacterota bacterium]